MKLQLPSVSLICVDCINAEGAIKVLEHCKSMVDFGDVKLLTSLPVEYEHKVEIMPLNSLIAYSVFMLTRVKDYFDTSHCLIVQRDGWILNPQSWDESWMQLDFLGPIFMQYLHVGSGGFSLRSKKLMEFMADITPKWDGTEEHAQKIQKTTQNYYEDGQICFGKAMNKFKFGSLEDAANFGPGGNRDQRYFRAYPFGYHRTHEKINFETGFVDSSDPTRDITNSYDDIISTF